MLTSKSQNRISLSAEAFSLLPPNFCDGLKSLNGTGFEVAFSLLVDAVVVMRGFLLVGLGVVASAVVLDGVARAVTGLGLKTGVSGRGAAVLVLPETLHCHEV